MTRIPIGLLSAALLLASLSRVRGARVQDEPSPPPKEPAAGAAAADPGTPPPPLPPSPLPPPGEMARCKRLIDAGLYAAARARLVPIVERHPDWARALGLLGLTYFRENRFAAANPFFARALAADPEEIAVRPLYGWSLYSLGELDAAVEMYASLLERMPEYAPAHYGLGLIHLDRDQVDSARRRLQAAARLGREQSDPMMEGRARARLGDLFARLDELEKARAELEAALELFPGQREALFKLSRVLQRLGDAEGAEAARRRFEESKAEQP